MAVEDCLRYPLALTTRQQWDFALAGVRPRHRDQVYGLVRSAYWTDCMELCWPAAVCFDTGCAPHAWQLYFRPLDAAARRARLEAEAPLPCMYAFATPASLALRYAELGARLCEVRDAVRQYSEWVAMRTACTLTWSAAELLAPLTSTDDVEEAAELGDWQ
jgi:hypothetical protein